MSQRKPQPDEQMKQAMQLQQRGDYAAAEQMYHTILHQDPHNANATHFLGMLAHQTGRSEQAIELMQKSLRLLPNNYGFLNNLGGVLLACGKPQDASEYFRKTLEINPEYAEAWQNYGSSLDATGHSIEAINCWRQALALKPQMFDVQIQLADACNKLGWHAEAIMAYEDALELKPGDAEVRVKYGAALAEKGQIEKGMALINEAIEREPKLPLAHFHKGKLFSQAGDFEQARAALRKAIELGPDFYQAYIELVGITRLSLDDPLAKKLEATSNDDTRSEIGRSVNINFSIAKILNDNKEYDRAFKHYEVGNHLRRQSLSYSTQIQIRYFETIKSIFNEKFLHRAVSFRTQVPIFIIGMARSGTTLLEQTLARHPLVHGAGELTILHDELRYQFGPLQNYEKIFNDIRSLSDANLGALAAICARKMQALAPQASRVIDKMPSNFMFLGMLHVLFPEARLIHCKREPMDTCFSCYTTLFGNNHEYSYNLTELGEFYGLYENLMQYWQDSLPRQRIMEVHYEDMVTNTETCLRQILAYCDIPWDDALLTTSSSAAVVRTASLYQVRQPIHNSSIGRWRHYERHLEPLKAALQAPLVPDSS